MNNSSLIYLIGIDEVDTALIENFAHVSDYKTKSIKSYSDALKKIESDSPMLVLISDSQDKDSCSKFMVKISEQLLISKMQIYLVSNTTLLEEDFVSLQSLGVSDVLKSPLNMDQLEVFNLLKVS